MDISYITHNALVKMSYWLNAISYYTKSVVLHSILSSGVGVWISLVFISFKYLFLGHVNEITRRFKDLHHMTRPLLLGGRWFKKPLWFQRVISTDIRGLIELNNKWFFVNFFLGFMTIYCGL